MGGEQRRVEVGGRRGRATAKNGIRSGRRSRYRAFSSRRLKPRALKILQYKPLIKQVLVPQENCLINSLFYMYKVIIVSRETLFYNQICLINGCFRQRHILPHNDEGHLALGWVDGRVVRLPTFVVYLSARFHFMT